MSDQVQRIMALADAYEHKGPTTAKERAARAALEAALREALEPKTLAEPCDECDGTMEPNTNGYAVYLRCVKCDHVPLVSADPRCNRRSERERA